MRKISQWVLAALFLALAVEIILVSPKRVNFTENTIEEEGLKSEQPNGEVQQYMKGIHLVESRQDQKEWELWATQAYGFKERSEWALKKVKAHFFAKDGVVFTVIGDEGDVELATKNMVIQGNVITRTSNGYEFKTNRVIYDSKNRLLSSPSFVEMKGPKDKSGHGLELKGETLKADLENSLMEVSKNIRATKKIRDERVLHLKSQRALLSGASNYARFVDDVVIDYAGMRMTGPDAKFQFDKTGEELSSVLVDGGVRVTDREKWATSKQVKFFLDDDKFVFKGNPRVVQDNDELIGDQIIFLNGGKRVEVIKARARVGKKHLEKVN